MKMKNARGVSFMGASCALYNGVAEGGQTARRLSEG